MTCPDCGLHSGHYTEAGLARHRAYKHTPPQPGPRGGQMSFDGGLIREVFPAPADLEVDRELRELVTILLARLPSRCSPQDHALRESIHALIDKREGR